MLETVLATAYTSSSGNNHGFAAHLALARYHVVRHPQEPARLTRMLICLGRMRAQTAADVQSALAVLARSAALAQFLQGQKITFA